MKKLLMFFILIICAVSVYSQEEVGKLTLKEPDIEIETVFYDSNIPVDIVAEIIKMWLINTKSTRLSSVQPELQDMLYQEIGKLVSKIDFSNITKYLGDSSEYFTITYNFFYQQKEYFVIAVLPENNYWFFENSRE